MQLRTQRAVFKKKTETKNADPLFWTFDSVVNDRSALWLTDPSRVNGPRFADRVSLEKTRVTTGGSLKHSCIGAACGIGDVLRFGRAHTTLGRETNQKRWKFRVLLTGNGAAAAVLLEIFTPFGKVCEITGSKLNERCQETS